MDQSVEAEFQLFMPYAFGRYRDFLRPGGKFVHYTTAEAAINMLRTEEVWMRNAQCMNDFMEIQHGYEYLLSYFDNDEKKRGFLAALDACASGVGEQALSLFDGWWASIQSNTYITSISEHDPREDKNGRLSMWRAYSGGSIGVAVVMNGAVFGSESDALGAYSSPVSYRTEAEFHAEADQIVSNIRNNTLQLAALSREHLVGLIYTTLLFATTCSKHPGFEEEREWRVIYTPKQNPSSVLTNATEVINGVPQTIYKVPLKNIPEQGLVGLEIRELVDRIIVGPSDFPSATYEAFVSMLESRGVENAAQKVWTSDIPLRRFAG